VAGLRTRQKNLKFKINFFSTSTVLPISQSKIFANVIEISLSHCPGGGV
jgi:hypothetical protein